MGDWGGILTLIGGLAGGLILSKLLAPQGQAPQGPAPTMQPQQAAPQQQAPNITQTPDYKKLLAANTRGGRSGPSAGPSSTFKTGPAGIDPSQLSLGTNTLLGS